MMHKLLLVDDEPFILNGMEELIRENLPLNIYKASSAAEALNILDRIRMDIVITDIQMPGMTGLQLLKEIHLRWPFCKVVILTAYSEFNYAQQALKDKASAYVLKSDGDDTIIQAIEKCINQLLLEMKQQLFLEESKEKAQAALPLLQNASLLKILEYLSIEQMKEELQIYQINLDVSRQVILTAVHIDYFPENLNSHEQFNLMLQIVEVMKCYLSSRYFCYHASFQDKNMVWLMQSREEEDSCIYLKEMLEVVQEHCRSALKISVSIVYDRFVSWEEVKERFSALKLILNQMVVNGGSLVLADSRFYFKKDAVQEIMTGELLNRASMFGKLRECLEEDDLAGFRETLSLLLKQTGKERATLALRLEIYHSLAQLMLAYCETCNFSEEFLAQPGYFNLFYNYCDGAQIEEGLNKMAEKMAELKKEKNAGHSVNIVEKINRFIEMNLQNDLSLTAISGKFYINPVYLSRFYKQTTGENLSDYITRKRLDIAKRMLRQSSMKINKIANEVGYESPAYFNRIFKKQESVTPQEYRDQQSNQKNG